MDGSTQRRPPFFWVALVVGTALAAVFVVVAFTAFRHGGVQRPEGWSARPVGAAWVVERVDPEGAAAGKLAPGDRILAVDGDTRIGRVGPGWILPALTAGTEYTVDVERGSVARQVTLHVPRIDAPGYRTWVTIRLFVAAICLVVAMMFGLARPDSRTSQYGFFSATLFSMFMMWLALEPNTGVLQDSVLALALMSSVPLYMCFAYLFLCGLPRETRAGRIWSVIAAVLVAWGVVIWAFRTVRNVARMTGPDAAIEFADRFSPLLRHYDRLVRPSEGLYVAVTIVACLAVMRRNYTLLPSLDERRRIHWVVGGLVVGLGPLVIVGLLDAVARGLGLSAELASVVDLGKKVGNPLVGLLPLTMVYAILRHRVLGIRVAIGMGLQYLLAKNLLRLALAAPLVWIAVRMFSNPDATVGEVLSQTASSGNVVLVGAALVGLRFRTRLLRFIDRKFFREDYSQEQILFRLSEGIRASEDLSEVLALASREVASALHVDRVIAFASREGHLVTGFSTGGPDLALAIPGDSVLHHQLDGISQSDTREHLHQSGSVHAAEWMDSLGLDLAVRIDGSDGQLAGVILLGTKRSEAAYTEEDRALLHAMAAQIGTAHEVMSLRERVDRERRGRRDVLDRLERRGVRFARECPECGRCYDSRHKRCEEDGSDLMVRTPVHRTLDDKYRLERLLGSGGMGSVYLATDLRLNRPVAVKVMVESVYGGSGAASRRFLREAQVSARLQHPNIVRIYDYAPLPDVGAYLVLEYVEGTTLQEHLVRRGRFPAASVMAIVEQLLSGMEAAHAASVIHRDLKPANVMLGAGGGDGNGDVDVKILDFGLAKVREAAFSDPKSRTRAGVAMGTVGYMSPEQFFGDDVDERTDVYALGVMTLELLTGGLNLRGSTFHRETRAQLTARLRPDATRPERARLFEVLKRSLAFDRDERYASVNALRHDLIPALRACPMPAASGSTTGPDDPTVGETQTRR